MSLGIFVYGVFVFAIVSAALGLLAWGIVNERRDRHRYEQGQGVFGAPGAELEAAANGATADRLRTES